ncbi:acyl-CoA thioesterase [Parapedobacter deserti]|uniref:Acyl-CoA thioesterase n=1 Tax=Parapedobacter deserti TaxID=1912957 RepID=A0ABV7JK07_9SPHI
MENVFYEGQIIWAQIDANRHLRHSAYADLCAQARSNMLKDMGLSLDKIAEMNIGPVLFREELMYLREIHLNDDVRVTVVMTRYNTANSRFSFRHEIYRSDGTKCAVVTVDGAWMDIAKRKLTVLPAEWQTIVERLPKGEDFHEVSV